LICPRKKKAKTGEPSALGGKSSAASAIPTEKREKVPDSEKDTKPRTRRIYEHGKWGFFHTKGEAPHTKKKNLAFTTQERNCENSSGKREKLISLKRKKEAVWRKTFLDRSRRSVGGSGFQRN